MMKKICKVCCILMTLVTLLLTVSPAMAEEKTMSGLYGDDLIWLFTPGNSTMTVKSKDEETSGIRFTGYARNTVSSWEKQGLQDKIRKVVVEEGVTKIGCGMFKGCSALEEVVLPHSLTHIYSMAFSGTAVSEIVIPENVVYVGDGAFSHCQSLRKVKCEGRHAIDLGSDLYFDTPLYPCGN